MRSATAIVVLVGTLGAAEAEARYYRPMTGNFLSADRAGMIDGPNEYAYVRNQPTQRTDPFGNLSVSGCGLGFLGQIQQSVSIPFVETIVRLFLYEERAISISWDVTGANGEHYSAPGTFRFDRLMMLGWMSPEEYEFTAEELPNALGYTEWNGGRGKITVSTFRRVGQHRVPVRIAHELIHWMRMYSDQSEDPPGFFNAKAVGWDPPPGAPPVFPSDWNVEEAAAQWVSYYLTRDLNAAQ